MMGHILISAAHKSSGKTTVSIGLCAALTQAGLHVRPFKKGPDYIDPMWLAKAAGNDCHNLDFNTQQHSEIIETFHRYSQNCDISVIEGNKGLYDGLDLDGSNSNAALAILLDAPVILVIDARGMTRGIAPLILGYQQFESKLNIAGVILNQLGGSRHESKLRTVIDHYTSLPVIGAVHHDPDLEIVERHLGLIPSNEAKNARIRIDKVAERIRQQVDLEQIINIANRAKQPKPQPSGVTPCTAASRVTCRIGVAHDAAFGFYYPGDFDAFREAGAELIFFSPLADKQLPAVDGLFIGGGFPETHMQALQDNLSMRQSIKVAIENALPVYAECGGLMYLTRRIHWKDHQCQMVGALPADTRMHAKPQGRGYVRLRETDAHPWPRDDDVSLGRREFAAHEFHYSSIENQDATLVFAYEVKRGFGINGKQDGILYKNVLGCYAHSRNVQNNQWVKRFVSFVQRHKQVKAPLQDSIQNKHIS
jgi:cobyrinic acid a,c-diamide synthase